MAGWSWLVRLVVAITVGTSTGGPALAEPSPTASALGLAKRARRAAKGGDLKEAVRLFAAAKALDPRAEYDCNIGVAEYQREDFCRAHLAFARCMARSGTIAAAYVRQVRQANEFVESELRAGRYAPVEILAAPAGSTARLSYFGPTDVISTPRQVWLPFGRHTLTFSAPGHQPHERVITVSGRKRILVQVTLAPMAKPKGQAALDHDADRDEIAKGPSATHTEEGPESYESAASIGPIVTFAAAGVALSFGIGFHVAATETRAGMVDLVDSPARDAQVAELEWRRGAMAAAYSAAGVGVLLGALWWVLGGDDTTSPVSVTPAADGLQLGWRIAL